ncbi:MAG: LacI family DNA-binding transcriptional regulator [Hyphomonadaceae bacterium]|nr:LacI family DNA-binding transcriptional regulator [Hyphomonadaceae bacterium]
MSSSSSGRRPSTETSRGGGRRRTTINDIARLAGVSKKTVSRVLNNSPFVREETRLKVNSLMQEMGYTPDPQARGLAFRRSFLIGMVFDNPNAQMVVTMQEGVLDGLKGSGFELVVHACDRNAKNFLPEVSAFVERQKLFGVILLPPISENNALVEMLTERGCHYVRMASAVIDVPGNLVASTDGLATAEAAKHLADLGHTCIGFIAGPPGFRSREERRAGFLAGLKERGIQLAAKNMVDGAYTYESGIAAAEKLLKLSPRPTAIFASNDEMAAGVYHAARQLGLSIPIDLSVVGFDDTPVSSRLWPPLTTVRWPIHDMGRAAAQHLLRAAADQSPDEDNAVFPAFLVERESTATAPK